MDQQIRFCTTKDGVRIAYATVGEGPAYVWVPGWISHLELSWADPLSRAAVESAARHFTIVRYDKRGNGLSDRQVSDYSLKARVLDLEAVVDDLKLKRFSLHGASEGGPVAIAYTARHPRLVSRLVLFGTFASGPALAAVQEHVGQALMALIRAEWGLGSQTMSNLLNPGAPAERAMAAAMAQREAASPDYAATMIEEMGNIDVTPLLPRIKAPTLVIHGRADAAIPFEMGRQLAGAIRGARLYAFEGGHLPTDPATLSGITAAQREFLMDQRGAAREPISSVSTRVASVASSLVTILFTDIEGSTAMTQQLGDDRAQELVRDHNAVVRKALQQHAGKEIKHTGDGIMASFASARGAVECAVAIQRALAAGDSVRVRIGLNAGEPVAEEQDLYGTSVQLAARVCAQAEGGEILVSNVVRELAAGKGFLFNDRGDHALKGFEDPVKLYEVGWRE